MKKINQKLQRISWNSVLFVIRMVVHYFTNMTYGVMCYINFILRIFNHFIVVYYDMRGRNLQLYCLPISADYCKHAILVVLVSLSNESFNFICCYASSTKHFLKKGCSSTSL